jgi:signal transduction histidine kinase
MLHLDRAFDTNQLRALHQVGKVVTASLDLDTTLEAILEAAHQLTRAQLVAILLLEDPEHLVIRVGWGAIGAAVGERVGDKGLVGRALREGRPVLVEDLLAEGRSAGPDLGARFGVRTCLAVPLFWHGEVLGAVVVGAPEPRALDPIHVGLVAELAEQAAMAVAHAHDYAREQTRRAEMEALYLALEERTQALEQVQQQVVQTEKLSAIGNLAHGIAHELNTPLGVIVSNLSVLGQYSDAFADVAEAARETVKRLRLGEPVESVAQALETAVRDADVDYMVADVPQLVSESTASGERIAAIVSSLGTFARRDTDHVSAVNLEQALESAVTLAWNELKHRAQLARCLTGVPPVLGHTSELTQVFVHLLLNAAQALEQQHGTITIASERDEQGVVVTIADTGRGIPPEHVGRVFDPFFTTRAPGQGTGMGLAVCHGIITRHGGSIGLASTPGKGTTVRVHLPAMVDEGALAA